MQTISYLNILLIAVTANLIMNAFLIWFMFKGFAHITSTLTKTVCEFESNKSTREMLQSMEIATRQAAEATQVIREKLQQNESRMKDFQVRYEFMLAKIDIRVERVAEGLTDNVVRVRDAVVKPAEKFGSIAGGIQSALGLIPGNEDDN